MVIYTVSTLKGLRMDIGIGVGEGGGAVRHCAPPPPHIKIADVRIRAKFGQIRPFFLIDFFLLVNYVCRDNLRDLIYH